MRPVTSANRPLYGQVTGAQRKDASFFTPDSLVQDQDTSGYKAIYRQLSARTLWINARSLVAGSSAMRDSSTAIVRGVPHFRG